MCVGRTASERIHPCMLDVGGTNHACSNCRMRGCQRNQRQGNVYQSIHGSLSGLNLFK